MLTLLIALVVTLGVGSPAAAHPPNAQHDPSPAYRDSGFLEVVGLTMVDCIVLLHESETGLSFRAALCL